jgi:Flp pilus assembly protein protease CpaA
MSGSFWQIVFVVVAGLIVLDIWTDMNRRGQPGWIYAALTVVAFPLGLIAWIWGRSKYPKEVRT